MRRSRRVLTVVQHPPTVVVRDGEIDGAALHRAGMSEGDLAAMLRGRSVRSIREIRCAIVEAAGSLSVLMDPAPDPAPPGPAGDGPAVTVDPLWVR